MDENHQAKAGNSRLTATENKLWLPPLSLKDQKKLDRFRSRGKKLPLNWTGFADRTLWDWLQFFAVLALPIIVAVGTLYFTQQITLQQAQLSIVASEKQHQTDLQIAATRYANDQQLAIDQQRETTLQTYLDNISDLLLNHNLSNSKPGDAVSEVAKERTLTTLRRLDAKRNSIVLRFLEDAHLIGMEHIVIDLSHTDLSGDDLSGVSLSKINLSGTNLSGANLSGAFLLQANLNGANLSGAFLLQANLNGANLSGAILSGTDLSLANLSFAHLNNAKLNNAKLRDANLKSAILDGAYTVFDDHDPEKIDLSGANLSGASLYNTELAGADLSLAELIKVDLRHTGLHLANLEIADLAGANLSNTSFDSVDFSYAMFEQANLYEADLSFSKANKADFTGADLRKANLWALDLNGTNFNEANLSGANLSLTNLTGANLSDADLHDADLRGARLSEANLDKAILKGARYNTKEITTADPQGLDNQIPPTVWPQTFDRKATEATCVDC